MVDHIPSNCEPKQSLSFSKRKKNEIRGKTGERKLEATTSGLLRIRALATNLIVDFQAANPKRETWVPRQVSVQEKRQFLRSPVLAKRTVQKWPTRVSPTTGITEDLLFGLLVRPMEMSSSKTFKTQLA